MNTRYIKIAFRWAWLLLLIPTLSVVATFLYNNSQPQVYRAVTRVLIGPGIDNPSVDLDSLRVGSLLMQTYSELVETETFLNNIIDEVGIDTNIFELRKFIEIQLVDDASIMTIVVDYTDEDLAVAMANEIAHSLVALSPSKEYSRFLLSRIREQAMLIESTIIKADRRLEELYNEFETVENPARESALIQRISGDSSISNANQALLGLFESLQRPFTNRVEIIEESQFAVERHADFLFLLIFASGAGITISILLLILLIYIDNLTVNEAVLKSNLMYHPIWGVIESKTKFRNSNLRKLSSTLVNQLKGKNTKKVMFTGASHSNLIAILASDVAVTLSRSGLKIALIDTDFTDNSIAARLKMFGSVSLIEALTDKKLKPLQPHERYPNLYVLPSGEITSDTFFLVNSPRFATLMEEISKEVDYIIIATSAFSSFESTLGVVSWAKYALVIVQEGQTYVSNLNETINNLRLFNSDILGTVMNKS